MTRAQDVLILGASYGSLLAAKLLLAGHNVKLVCLPDEADLINGQGIRVSIPIKQQHPIELDSRTLPGRLCAAAPADITATDFDIAVLAMQEPQYRFDDVRTLVNQIAVNRIPCLSIMNMPPLPYLARLPGLDVTACRASYTEPDVWRAFDPALVTHSSADPQASRSPDHPSNHLEVRLPSNFKAARFEGAVHTDMLRALASDISAPQLTCGTTAYDIPVKLKVNESPFIPLSKWPMLITGNYRCITADGIRSIESAVHSDLAASREIYQWVLQVCRSLGAPRKVLVPFGMYAAAAHALKGPSSAARALAAGAEHIERVDHLIQIIAAQQGMESRALNEIVGLVDDHLAVNRGAGSRSQYAAL